MTVYVKELALKNHKQISQPSFHFGEKFLY